MPQLRFVFLVAAVAFSASFSVCRAEQILTYADLVNRMTDLAHLAELPAAGEKCAQASSYDRASKYDEKTGKYINWGANGDNDGVIRHEGRQVVMAEIQGPGCIWRIWSAMAKQGRVSIYLDGQETPAVDLPFENYFSGDTPPFNYPMLSYNLATLGCQGQDLYMPIPFQKSCKVVANEGWGAYYHFTYSTFPKDTKVPTFSSALVEKDNAAALQKVNDFFQDNLGEDPGRASQRPGDLTEERDDRAGRNRRGRQTGWAASDYRLEGQDVVRRSQGPNGRPAKARLADHLGWPGQPGRVVPAGRFLRHRPGRKPL